MLKSRRSAWVDHGAPEGNPADMPPPRQFGDFDKWHIGKPDLIVSMSKPYVLKAMGRTNTTTSKSIPASKRYFISALKHEPDLGFKVVHHCRQTWLRIL